MKKMMGMHFEIFFLALPFLFFGTGDVGHFPSEKCYLVLGHNCRPKTILSDDPQHECCVIQNLMRF